MKLISASAVERLLPMGECIALMRQTMMAVSAGAAVQPLRQFMAVPDTDGKMGLMPGALTDEAGGVFGVKIVSKFPRPPGDPHGTHVGAVMLFDAARGLPRALIEGGSLTAIRTAAASAAATDALACKDAQSLLIVGAGEEAWRHGLSLPLVRAFGSIVVWARAQERAQALADRLATALGRPVQVAPALEAAAGAADVICTTTSAREPILPGAWVRPGTHVTLVGSAIPETAEVDEALVARALFVVDRREAALAAAGELRRAIAAGLVGQDHIHAEIGAVFAGAAPGRTSPDQVTIYKSLGVIAQDLAAARLILAKAEAEGGAPSFDLAG